MSTTRSRSISLSTLTVRGTPPWEIVECAHDCGYTHAGFRFRPVIDGEPLLPIVGNEERLRLIEDRLRTTGVKVLDVEFFWIKPETQISGFIPYLEAAARLGAQNILVGGGDPDRRRFVERWLELCDVSASYRLRPHLEFMPMSEVRTYADGISIMESSPHPNAGLMIDPLHFDRGGSSITEILPAHYAYMSYMQLCDAYAERPASLEEMQRQAKGDRLPPGRGGLDLIGLLRALPPSLPLSLEVPLAHTEDWSPRRKARLVFNATKELLARVDAAESAVR